MMAGNLVFDISKITVPVAAILGAAWVMSSKGVLEGIMFFLLSIIFYFLIFLMNTEWEREKYRNGWQGSGL